MRDRRTQAKRQLRQKQDRAHRTPLAAKATGRLSGARLRVLVIYTLSLSSMLLTYYAVVGTSLFSGFLALNARATGYIAGLFAQGVHMDGNLVSSGGFTIRIVGDCTNLAALSIYTAAVLAFPSQFKQKLVGVCVGALAGC